VRKVGAGRMRISMKEEVNKVEESSTKTKTNGSIENFLRFS